MEPAQQAAAGLARLAVARDAGAWSVIFDSHYRSIYSFVRARLPGSAEAEDLASQVFEVAYASAHRFDYRGAPIEAWLIGIARNVVRDHRKKLARRGATEELTELAAPTEDDASEAIARKEEVLAAMSDLTEDQQTVLGLRFLLDWSVLDTAAAVGRSEDAVKTLQRRALAAMRRAMERQGTGR